MESGYIEFVPVIERRRSADKACEERAARVRTGAADFRSVREGELIGAHFVGEAVGAALENKPWRRDRVQGSGTGGADVVEPGYDGRLGGRAAGTAMAYSAGTEEDRLALLFERGEGRVGVREWGYARADGIGDRAHAGTAE